MRRSLLVFSMKISAVPSGSFHYRQPIRRLLSVRLQFLHQLLTRLHHSLQILSQYMEGILILQSREVVESDGKELREQD